MTAYPRAITHHRGQRLVLDRSRVVVFHRRVARRADVEKAARRVGLRWDGEVYRRKEGLFGRGTTLNERTGWLWVRTRDRRPLADHHVRRLDSEARLGIDVVAPVYRLEGVSGDRGLYCPLPHTLIVRPREGLGPPQRRRLRALLRRLRLVEVEEKSRYLGSFRYLRLRNPRARGSIATKAALERAGRGLIDGVSLELMPMRRPADFVPNDTHYGRQWNLRTIRAEAAWDLVNGAPTVVVAVIDSGCDLGHPELEFASDGVNLDTMSGTGAPVEYWGDPDAHGTCCAGIIAARLDNSLGVAGIAGGCRILPIARVAGTPEEGALGIRYAADHGAHVVSMSFGGGLHSDAQEEAVQYAWSKGLVLCASSGNEGDDPPLYPARYHDVMAVGAVSTDDDLKTPDSPDGEDWGSNYGDAQSVVAPGVTIPTTDVEDEDGYNKDGGKEKIRGVKYDVSGDSGGDYFYLFNGTSAAAPHVAGVAALVLSANPFASNVDVRDVIEMTADKVGSTAYARDGDHPNGTWNRKMGYGRIDARDAVEEAALTFVGQLDQLMG